MAGVRRHRSHQQGDEAIMEEKDRALIIRFEELMRLELGERWPYAETKAVRLRVAKKMMGIARKDVQKVYGKGGSWWETTQKRN